MLLSSHSFIATCVVLLHVNTIVVYCLAPSSVVSISKAHSLWCKAASNEFISPPSFSKNSDIKRVLDLSVPSDLEYFKSHIDGKEPAIIRNAFPNLNNEEWTEKLLELNGNALIEYDVRFSSSGMIESYECALNEFIESLFDGSSHEESMYLMNEDILNDIKLNKRLLNDLNLPSEVYGDDLFSYFPEKMRPKIALIIGGIGARSFLHGDPYEWTGWNYLFEGEKIWTFIPPVTPDNLLRSRRNAPDAWGSEYSISAGWVSDDVDLYKNIVPPKKKKNISALGISRILDSQSAVASGAVAERLPLFTSGDAAVDSCDPSLLAGAFQILQREGDLVIIPPRWWHQVYHVAPSVAVASQYANENVRDKMFLHIAAWSGVNLEDILTDNFISKTDRDQVLELVRLALCKINGSEKGSDLFNSLLADEQKEESES